MNYKSPYVKKSYYCVFFYIVAIVFLLIATFFLGRCSVKTESSEPVVKIDTSYFTKYDTVYVHKIQWKEKIKEVKIIDTVYVSKDTFLEVTQKHYEDSIASIYVSGIEPELDSVIYFLPTKEVCIKKEIQTTKYKKSGLVFSMGLYCGYGAAINNGVLFMSPEIGIGGSIGFGWIIDTQKQRK